MLIFFILFLALKSVKCLPSKIGLYFDITNNLGRLFFSHKNGTGATINKSLK